MKHLAIFTTLVLSIISANSYAIYCGPTSSGQNVCSAVCTGHATSACLDKLAEECRANGCDAPVNTGGTTYSCSCPTSV